MHIASRKWKFVNREKPLARVAALNIRNNFLRHKRYNELQRITLPVAMHTFGAGKTEFAEHYVMQLREDAVQKAIKEELKQMESDPKFPLPGLSGYGTEQLTVMFERPPVMLAIIYSSGDPPESYFQRLHVMLSKQLYGRPEPPVVPDYKVACEHLLIEVLAHVPVFLSIDEVGGVRDFDDFRQLRTWLGILFSGQKQNSIKFPLYVFLCGRFAHEMQEDMSNRATSRISHEQVLLEPFNADHAAEVHRSLPTYREDLGTALYQKVIAVTGGIPRLIRFLLTLLDGDAVERTESAVASHACTLVEDPAYSMEFARLDEGWLRKFGSCLAVEELDKGLPAGRAAYLWMMQMVRALPVLSVKQEGVYKLKCCPMWVYRFREELKELNYEGLLGATPYLLAPRTVGESREFDVLLNLGERMLSFLAAARIPSKRPPYPGMPIDVDLSILLPFLFGPDSAGAYPVLAALGEHLSFDSIPCHFSPQLDRLQMIYDSATVMQSRVTPETTWLHLEAVAEENTLPDAAALFLARHNSHSPDIFFRLPSGMPMRLISFQVKSNRSNAIAPSVLMEDCIKKMPRDVPGRYVHVLLADEVTREFESHFQNEHVVLQGSVGKQTARVVRPEVVPADSYLQQCAEALPDGAVLVVLHPIEFKRLMPRRSYTLSS